MHSHRNCCPIDLLTYIWNNKKNQNTKGHRWKELFETEYKHITIQQQPKKKEKKKTERQDAK